MSSGINWIKIEPYYQAFRYICANYDPHLFYTKFLSPQYMPLRLRYNLPIFVVAAYFGFKWARKHKTFVKEKGDLEKREYYSMPLFNTLGWNPAFRARCRDTAKSQNYIF